MLKAMVWGITLVVLSDVTAASEMFLPAKSLVFATAMLTLVLGKTKGSCLLIILFSSWTSNPTDGSR